MNETDGSLQTSGLLFLPFQRQDGVSFSNFSVCDLHVVRLLEVPLPDRPSTFSVRFCSNFQDPNGDDEKALTDLRIHIS